MWIPKGQLWPTLVGTLSLPQESVCHLRQANPDQQLLATEINGTSIDSTISVRPRMSASGMRQVLPFRNGGQQVAPLAANLQAR
jgi:hypothetical protein